MNSKKTSAMSGPYNEEKALVPRLRFPEFQDEEGWEIRPFHQLFTIGNGRDYKHLEGGDVPVYGSGGYMLSVSDHLHDGESVCIGRKGTINNPIFLSGKFWTVDTLFYTHSFRNCLPRFIYLLFQGIDWLKHNEAGGVPSLSKANIGQIKAAVPKPSEQEKIADCLFSLDDLITEEGQKLDTLKIHKKGLMQQLFPREGETVPRLRFPEFRKAGAWAKVTAGELFSNRTERGDSGLPIYSVTTTEGLVPRASLDRRIEDVAESGAHKTVRKGDIAYNMMRMWQGALGIAPEDCMVSPAYIVLEPQAGVNPVFFYFMLKLPQTLHVLTAHSRGLTEDRLRLYYDDFAKIPLRCPSPSEQERIADSLTSVDSLITAQLSKIDALKIHKKSLMQQLFPVMAEVLA
ncbi:restriction endonuclease subunit S [Pandoraea apista]|uniref:restriction endonuclease subunit S n=1 Tax=Pandoraea apista TaxID=93218 RepID=UPI00058A9151|nr:restriction endonuclease subunit S [Pandoraea apista]AJE98286.1 hypothetical protein SG18_08985 [Pandoraea apista]AKH72334.1 hypothetical protein XM39_09185 [Pandoraea apista]AKI60725.1 hypothetical protein AA956_01440 [Pandoraea apista]